jgi:CHASE1-domain containing sensor protein
MPLRKEPEHRLLHSDAFPRLLALAFLALTATSSYYISFLSSSRDENRFNRLVDQVQSAITARVDLYVNSLISLRAHLLSAGHFTGSTFYGFAGHLDLRTRLPGIQGIGYAARALPEERALIADQARAEGVQDFHIHPDPRGNDSYPILYLYPLDIKNKLAIGYDMFSEPIRRTAMQRARDTGAPAASAKVILVQDQLDMKQPGFLIYLPLYSEDAPANTVDDRRKSLRGFVYAPFRAGDLLRGILGTPRDPSLHFDVYDGESAAPEARLYDSNEESQGGIDQSAPLYTSVRR